MNIPILRLPFDAIDKAEILKGISTVFDSGHLTQGKFTQEFEKETCELTGAKYSIATSNCTTALEIIIRALGIYGKSIIVPTNTFMATAFAVMHSGNRVIFADSSIETLCLDPAGLESRLQPDTAAVLLVHIGGVMTGDFTALRNFCAKHNLYLIEDCAHAHGCTLEGKQAGTLGIAGAFSYFPTKVLVTGEGGMITTNDESLYKEALKIRNHGKDSSMGNRMSTFGHNYRMSEFTAVVGVQQMKRARQIFEERQEVAKKYDRLLQGVPNVRPLRLDKAATSTYYKYIAYLDDQITRSEVKKVLKEKHGVSLTGEVYADLCHTEPLWDRFTASGEPRIQGESNEFRTLSFPKAEYASRHHVCLPLYTGLGPTEVEYVVESLDKVLNATAAQAR